MSAYLDEERIMNEAIANQEADDFALAVVDMSGYRKLRETMGQKAADLAVQKLSAIVCEVFDHSPVFRIREDEFIAILRRRDYENRAELMERLETIKTENAAAGEVTFNYGMAEFRPGEDRRLSVVFERASQEMVSRK